MSKMVSTVRKNRAAEASTMPNAVVNFMGGTSYTLTPVDALKLVSASSIFGEPQYYRNGEFAERGCIEDGVFVIDECFAPYASCSAYVGMKTSEMMEKIIDEALDYDFKAVLDWAVTLRTDFYMRLNPQVIMVRAALHPKRQEFSNANPGLFAEYNSKVMTRPDEPSTQLTYYLYLSQSKSKIPGILKRSWASKIGTLSARDIYKYRNSGIGMIDTVRICHAHSPLVDELIKTGTVSVPAEDKTWETMRASGASWKTILDTIKLGHMALLRNLRGIFTEIDDADLCEKILDQLKSGVLHGKQFPFRYMSAMEQIEMADVNHKALILDALEECMDISCDNMPHLKGKTMCLSDNSGSAWGAVTSEYGSATIAEIDNLSSVITARNSDEGYVGKFGDELHSIPVRKRNGVLAQTSEVNTKYKVGGNTENGIWLFFDKAIREKEHWDNIFVYSDEQAGHGGLYGIKYDSYKDFCIGGRYIDVAKLIDTYRKKVNPKVNVYCVQTAGYDNVLVPENGYRTSILYGWTGKELVYADKINKFWDDYDATHSKNKQS